MESQKKRKRNKCSNHPRRIAIGRCSKCKKWICKECAVLYQCKFYCKETCSPEKKSAVSPTKPSSKVPPSRNIIERISCIIFTKDSILLWSGVTFGLCGIVFGLVQIKKNREIEDNNLALKKNRIELVSLIKKKNIRIKELLEKYAGTRTRPVIKHRAEDIKKLKDYKQSVYSYSDNKLPITFNNGVSTKKLIALTFDGGSYKNASGAILDTLRSRNVAVTMFLTGKFIRKNNGLVRRIIAEGHEVGNHTTNHPHLTTWSKNRRHQTLPNITESFIENELKKANYYFKHVTGGNMIPLWRAPYGEQNRQINVWAQKCGYLHIGWKQARTWQRNFDTNDWVPNPETPGYHSPEEVLNKFNRLADTPPYGMNGAIILMHIGTERISKDQQVHRILGKMIDQLRGKGYKFVSVTTLLKESGVDISLLKRR